MESGYTSTYFEMFRQASRSSAAAVVPRVRELLQPRSVVDVGCGIGDWAATFKQCGVAEVLGIDGAEVHEASSLTSDEFLLADLTQPLPIDRHFDLAVSLEVAEHLPAEYAPSFVATLTRLAPAVLFSAAVPHQGGLQHVNEQWPDYWIDCFAAHGRQPLDLLRREFWRDDRVEWWYAQNMLLFVTQETAERLRREWKTGSIPDQVLPLVHPRSVDRLAWQNHVLHVCVDLAGVIPVGKRLILVDEEQLGEIYLPDRTIIPFTEQEGRFHGPPADDNAALAELDRQIARGADFFAVASPAFWYLDHYAALAERLQAVGPPLLKNARMVVYAL